MHWKIHRNEKGLLIIVFLESTYFNFSVKAMLLLIQCKYRILEKFKPPPKKPLAENGDVVQFDKTKESDGLMEGEEKTVVDMEIDIKVCRLLADTVTHIFYHAFCQLFH